MLSDVAIHVRTDFIGIVPFFEAHDTYFLPQAVMTRKVMNCKPLHCREYQAIYKIGNAE